MRLRTDTKRESFTAKTRPRSDEIGENGERRRMVRAEVARGCHRPAADERGYSRAIGHFEEARRILQQHQGADSVFRAAVNLNLARCYLREGRQDEAMALFDETLLGLEEGGDVRTASLVLFELADISAESDDFEASLGWIDRAIGLLHAAPGALEDRSAALQRRAELLRALGRYEQMRIAAMEASEFAQAIWGEAHEHSIAAAIIHVEALQHLNEEESASSLLRATVDLLQRRESDLGRALSAQRKPLIACLRRAGMDTAADALR